MVLAYPAYLGLQYRKLPPIHDITTDPIDPPRFEALARLRSGDGTNTAVYAGLYSAEQQRLAYPDIEPVELEIPVHRAYEIALQLVNKRKWLVIDERAAAAAAPHRPHRGGGADADHGIPRGRLDPRHARRRGFRVDIRSVLALFRERSRQQRRADPKLIDDINTAVDNANAPAGRRNRSRRPRRRRRR